MFSAVPAEYNDLQISCKLIFARELGGDYYHFHLDDEGIFFCVADISGKSLGAALFSALLHESVLEALERSKDPSKIVSHVNARLFPALPTNMFITLFSARIEQGRLSFANAGHEPALLLRSGARKATQLLSTARLPIGLQPALEIETTTEEFSPGDILVSTTDGITDSLRVLGDPYEKLGELLYRMKHRSAHEIVEAIARSATPEGVDQPADDVVAICIKRSSGE